MAQPPCSCPKGVASVMSHRNGGNVRQQCPQKSFKFRTDTLSFRMEKGEGIALYRDETGGRMCFPRRGERLTI